MSKRSPHSSSLVARVRRHWLLVAIAGLAFVALWAGQPALAADARPPINQTVPPATPRPEVPSPDNKEKKDKQDNKENENKPSEAAPAVEQATAEPGAEAMPEPVSAATPEITVEPAAVAAAATEQAPESLPETGGGTSLPLVAVVAGAALFLLVGVAFVTRRSA